MIAWQTFEGDDTEIRHSSASDAALPRVDAFWGRYIQCYEIFISTMRHDCHAFDDGYIRRGRTATPY